MNHAALERAARAIMKDANHWLNCSGCPGDAPDAPDGDTVHALPASAHKRGCWYVKLRRALQGRWDP